MIDSITLKFDGRVAEQHLIEARQLGNSLLGVDKAVNTGLILLTQGRAPLQRERFNLFIAAQAPKQGSVDLVTVIHNAPWLLPLVHDVVVSYGADYLRNFISCVLFWHGGRKAEGMEQMDKMIDLAKEIHRHNEISQAQWQGTLIEVIDRLAPAAKQIVEPVGRTAATLEIAAPTTKQITIIDEPTAEAIRSKEEIELQDVVEMDLRIDGIIRHTRTLKVEMPDQPGQFVTADVRDPVFDEMPNAYTDAFSKKESLRVRARPAHRNGQLYKLYVMELVS